LRLEAKGVRNTLDGEGRWVDNAFIERLSRGVKYEEVRLPTCATPSEVDTALERCFRSCKAYEIPSNQLGPPLCP
jgi:putative transposase